MPFRLQHYPPQPALRDIVKTMWTSARDFQPPDDKLEILPDSYVELVFSFGDLWQIEAGQAELRLPRCYVVGLLDRPLRLQGRGVIRSVAARFFAWGFSSLFGLDMQPLTRAVYGLDNSWHDLTERIERAMHDDDEETAVNALHDFLSARALQAPPTDKAIQKAAQQLAREQGQATIRELATGGHYSQRQLERKFKRSTGLAPKALARRIRFENARDHLTRDPSAELNRVAQEYGYADQAHFTRDFRHYAGKTPAQFAAEMAALREALRAKYRVVFLQD